MPPKQAIAQWKAQLGMHLGDAVHALGTLLRSMGHMHGA